MERVRNAVSLEGGDNDFCEVVSAVYAITDSQLNTICIPWLMWSHTIYRARNLAVFPSGVPNLRVHLGHFALYPFRCMTVRR